MRTSNAVRHIEHIASLRLAPHIAIPEMLRSLGGIVPGARPGFFWVDGAGSILDAYVPDGALAREDVAPVAAAGPLFAYRDDGGFQMSFRVGGQVRAILAMRRAAHAACFTERERRILSTLAPCFSRALASQPADRPVFDDVADRIGVIVAEEDGRIVSADADALQLLLEMLDQPLIPALRAPCHDGRLPPFLLDLVRRRSCRTAPVPAILQKTTRWGAYRARAFAQLGIGESGDTPRGHAIMVARHLPQTVRLMRTIEACDLSPRERQAAFQLGIGADATAGAAALGVSITTWRSYVKRVYQRLDVRDRVELMSRLGGATQTVH